MSTREKNSEQKSDLNTRQRKMKRKIETNYNLPPASYIKYPAVVGAWKETDFLRKEIQYNAYPYHF